jgi:hypothetical protein
LCEAEDDVFKMSSMSFFTDAPSRGFSSNSQEICNLILRNKSAGRICLFAPEQQQTPFFLQLIAFY